MDEAVKTTPKKSLYEAFLALPDHRDPRGVRHPLHAVLTLSAWAIVSGAKSLSAISEFGRAHSRLWKIMGFSRKNMPAISTLHYVFAALDIKAFETALSAWALTHFPQTGFDRMIHIDGKSLRGSGGASENCIHLLAAYCSATSTVLAQMEVGDKTNEHKKALELLHFLPMKDTLATGDAMFVQRDLAKEIIDKNGDYFLVVKDNQKTLRQGIEAAFGDDLFSPPETGTGRQSAAG
jgi:hypothetical protein